MTEGDPPEDETIEVETVEEKRRPNARRAKRNPRVEQYARNIEAYAGEHGSRRSSHRRRGRSTSSRRHENRASKSSHRSAS